VSPSKVSDAHISRNPLAGNLDFSRYVATALEVATIRQNL